MNYYLYTFLIINMERETLEGSIHGINLLGLKLFFACSLNRKPEKIKFRYLWIEESYVLEEEPQRNLL